MPHGGGGRRSEITCRCPACDYETSVDEGEKCELLACPRCQIPLREGISKGSLPQGPGRREDESKVVIGPWPPVPPLPPGTKECRCPSCDYREVIEEGARCLNSVCPECGSNLVSCE